MFHVLSNGTDLTFFFTGVGLLTKGSVDRTTLLELIAQLGTQLRCSFNPQVSASQETLPAQRSPDSVGMYTHMHHMRMMHGSRHLK